MLTAIPAGILDSIRLFLLIGADARLSKTPTAYNQKGLRRYVPFTGPGRLRALPARSPHLIVFADDWGRHPSSAQHLVRHLLERHEVAWINTIGTRAPQLNAAIIRRGLDKVLQWTRPSAPDRPGAAPRVFSPVMYPGFRTAWQRRMNAALLARFLRGTFGDLADTTVVSTVPIVADLRERVPARRWVYYCVDDFSSWPGLDAGPLRGMERQLVARADRVIAAGENLSERMRQYGRHAEVISHGIDLEHWRGAGEPTSLLERLPRPIFLFWGLIDRRLDVPTLRALDARMSAGTIALVGPEQDPDPALARLARVRRLGPAPYEVLPTLASQAAALLIPYSDLPVTRAMQPLKLKEYLASGRPVVSTRLPALAGWEDCLDIADDPGKFAELALLRAAAELPAAQRAGRRRLDGESWKAKSARFAGVLFGD